jgi:hypothetical protein
VTRRKAPAHGDLRAALERDLQGQTLEHRDGIQELARKLADELDRKPAPCSECGGHRGPDPATVLRYADALEALGIGSVPVTPPKDQFTQMLERFAGATLTLRGATPPPHPPQP